MNSKHFDMSEQECSRWITKVTYIQSEHAMFIAFTRQQWSRECASMLRYTLPVLLSVKLLDNWALKG